MESLLPIIDANGSNADEIRDEILAKAQKVFLKAVNRAINTKLVLEVTPIDMAREVDKLWEEIEPLLRTTRIDWSPILQLSFHLPKAALLKQNLILTDRMMATLLGTENTHPFYDPLSNEHRESLLAWLQKRH